MQRKKRTHTFTQIHKERERNEMENVSREREGKGEDRLGYKLYIFHQIKGGEEGKSVGKRFREKNTLSFYPILCGKEKSSKVFGMYSRKANSKKF